MHSDMEAKMLRMSPGTPPASQVGVQAPLAPDTASAWHRVRRKTV